MSAWLRFATDDRLFNKNGSNRITKIKQSAAQALTHTLTHLLSQSLSCRRYWRWPLTPPLQSTPPPTNHPRHIIILLNEHQQPQYL